MSPAPDASTDRPRGSDTGIALGGPPAGLPGPLRVAIWMTLAGAAFATMGGLIKFAAQDLHPFEVAFFRCFFGLVWMAPWLLRYGPAALRTRRLPLYAARATIGLVGMLAGFYALRYIPLADATALSFTAPLFATIGAAVVLRETVRAAALDRHPARLRRRADHPAAGRDRRRTSGALDPAGGRHAPPPTC